MSFNKIVSVLILTCFLRVQAISSEKEYGSMPNLFHLDDFDNCLLYGEKALYCYFAFQLSPIDPGNTSDVWNIINEVISHPNNYRHDKLRHGYCINKACPELEGNITAYQNNNDLLKTDLLECLNRKFADIRLKTTITDTLRCQTIHKRPLDVYDYSAAIFFLVLFALVVLGTFYEGLPRYKSKEEYKRITSTKFGKIISCFSVVKNWERLTSEPSQTDQGLGVLNAVRFYNILMVIIAHTCLVSFGGPISNPVFVEQVAKNFETIIIANGYYAIQTFYIVSGWLLCYHFFLMFEEKKNIKFSYILLAFVNRYIRLTPAYLVMIIFNATWLYHLNSGPAWHKIVGYETDNCRNNWWANLLYINNFYDPQHMCIQQSWYIATDSQLFLVSMFVLTLTLKFKKYIKFIFGTCFAISMIIPALITYIGNYDIVIRQYAESLYTTFLDQIEWHVMYASPFPNFGGYVIGMIFGYLFYMCRDTIVFTQKKQMVLWWILTFGLPLSIIYLGLPIYENDEKPHIILCALYAGTAKVIFAFGIALGLFGASQNEGWFLRSVLTWKPAQYLGRLTYCVYLVHTSLMRVRVGMTRSPAYTTPITLLYDVFGDYTIALVFAVFLCLLIELPISALQKVWIPQLASKRAKRDNKNAVHQITVTNGIPNMDNLTKV